MSRLGFLGVKGSSFKVLGLKLLGLKFEGLGYN